MAMTTVVVVDDDDAFRRSTARMLESNGYTCLEASNGDEAVAAVENGDVVAALCDVRLSGSSGLALLGRLRAEAPELAIIMITGLDDPQVAESSFDLGAFGYLVKPFDDNELLVLLSSAIRHRSLELSRRAYVRALETTIERHRIVGGVVDGLQRGTTSDVSQAEEITDRLSRALTLRDEETGSHIERMSRYAAVIAEAAGYDAMSLDELRLATALHDVGKIGIPDDILLKPGPLSRDEYCAMQRHAQIGYQLLAGSDSEILRAAADIALHHHERWDGTGYPHGLRGEEISQEARLAAVADVFDALTSNRVYRPALSFEEACALMEEGRGKHFEPRLLDALVASIGEIGSIRQSYPDEGDALQRIRILVVDDHEIFAQSLIRLLGGRSELKVVGTAATVADAVKGALAHEPDLVLMDAGLPDGDGASGAEQIKALRPDIKVIMLTGRADQATVTRAIAAGCAGFVRKEEAVETLIDTILAVHRAETLALPFDPATVLPHLRPTRRGLGVDLTTRELQILELSARGRVNKEIAADLGLRLNTVRNHMQHILEKLQAHSKLEAVATAVREGLIAYS